MSFVNRFEVSTRPMDPFSESQPSDRPADETAEVRPGRRLLYKPENAKPNAGEALAQVIAYLTSLQSTLAEENPKADPSPGVPGRSVLQEKRLSRSGAISADVLVRPDQRYFEYVPGNSQALFGDNEWAVLSGLVTPTASPGGAEPSPGMGKPRRARRLVPLGWLFLALAFGALSCFTLFEVLGHQANLTASAPRPAANAEDAAGASDSALQIARQAIDAIHAGGFRRAYDLFAQARRQGIFFPGMRYQAALLALTQGNQDAAFGWIDGALAANEAVPACLYLRARLECKNGDYIGATESFADAVRFAPFDPRSYFFLAESLRRNGHPTQAIPQFEQALRCRPDPADADLILFKWRLAQIETGQDNDFQAQLAEKLTQEPVSGDTLLLAAASAINRGVLPEAAAYAHKAALVLPPSILAARMGDFAFGPLVLGKTAPAAFPAGAAATPAQSPGKTLVDPATRGLQEADPANW